jgi:hypothetical protein
MQLAMKSSPLNKVYYEIIRVLATSRSNIEFNLALTSLECGKVFYD